MDQNIQEPQVTPEAQETQEEQAPDIADFLSAFPGAPTHDQINQWKATYGEVLCSGFSDTELYIWRPLSRQEFLEIQQEVRQAAQAGQQAGDAEIELRIVGICTLWASDPGRKALDSKGGSISTLHEQIMLSSNFLPSNVAVNMVIKL